MIPSIGPIPTAVPEAAATAGVGLGVGDGDAVGLGVGVGLAATGADAPPPPPLQAASIMNAGIAALRVSMIPPAAEAITR